MFGSCNGKAISAWELNRVWTARSHLKTLAVLAIRRLPLSRLIMRIFLGILFGLSVGAFPGAVSSAAVVGPSAIDSPPPIRYQLDLREPASHLVHVQMMIPDAPPALAIQFPAWNALYQIRDFVLHAQNLTAACDGAALELDPIDVNTWQTGSQPCTQLTVSYAVYANEESVFSAVLDARHVFLNLAQVLFYLPADRARATQVTFLLPDGWKLATPLDEETGVYFASNYDRLVDSPVEAGNFDEYSYPQNGAEYQVVVYSDRALYPSKKLLDTLQKITAAETALMQDVPFHRYTFIFHFLPSGGGGMEHAYGTAIGFRADDLDSDWEELESTIAHEFFHLWNVKRIRPRGLEPINYVRGNDTRDLWFSEGVTSTYEELVLVRSGLVSRPRFYERLAGAIGMLEERPARHTQSVELAGMDAWLEGYADYDRPERSISYYDKGELLGFLLDLAMRKASEGRSSLDDLMRGLNRDYAGQGRYFQDRDLMLLIGKLTGGNLDAEAFFRDYVMGTRDLDYQRFLGYAGLALQHETVEAPDWGFRAGQGFGGPIQVESVGPGSTAERAGLRPGDVLKALNGQPLTVFPERVSGVKAGQKVELQIQRRSRKLSLKFQLGKSVRMRYHIAEDPGAAPDQIRLREAWLGGG